jgi:hypothetical protein
MQNPREPGVGIAGASSVSCGSGTESVHSDPASKFQPAFEALDPRREGLALETCR